MLQRKYLSILILSSARASLFFCLFWEGWQERDSLSKLKKKYWYADFTRKKSGLVQTFRTSPTPFWNNPEFFRGKYETEALP